MSNEYDQSNLKSQLISVTLAGGAPINSHGDMNNSYNTLGSQNLSYSASMIGSNANFALGGAVQ